MKEENIETVWIIIGSLIVCTLLAVAIYLFSIPLHWIVNHPQEIHEVLEGYAEWWSIVIYGEV